MALLRLFLLLLPFLGYSKGEEKSPTVGNRIPKLCLTTEGERCIFPFMFKSQKYSKCTYTSSLVPRCPTLLDTDGTVVNNRWGDCSTDRLSSCEIEPNKISTCITSGGPSPNKPCIFPFRHNGRTYSICTSDSLGQPWCSTATHPNGSHISGLGQYGLCPSTCPGVEQPTTNCIPGETFSNDCNTCVCRSNGLAVCTLSVCPVKCSVVTGPATGSECAFPFTWRGKTWRGCAPWTYGGLDQGKGWCSTATNNNGGHINGKGNYGICGPDCPIGTDQEPIIIEGRINLIPNDLIMFEESVNLAPT